MDSAMDELLETDLAVTAWDRLYRCLDRVLVTQTEVDSLVETEMGQPVSLGHRGAALRSHQHVL